MASLNGFNASEVDPNFKLKPLPAGDYTAAIVASEYKTTKAGTGQYLEIKFEVIDGEHKGRTLFSRLNLVNPSDVAVGIARSELSAICHAVRVMSPQDSVQLHNIPLTIEVGLQKDKTTGDLNNNITGYRERGKPKAAAGAGGSQKDVAGTTSGPVTPGGKPAWMA